MQLGLKEGSETVALPREPATLTFTILKHSLVVNSKPELKTESLDFFTMWKKGMLLTFGGVPGKFARWKWARISVLKYSSIHQYPLCSVLNSLYLTCNCQVDKCVLSQGVYSQFSELFFFFQVTVRRKRVHITCVGVWRKSLSRARSLILIGHCTNTQRCHLTAVLQKQ